MQKQKSKISKSWKLVPGTILGHKYWARKMTEEEFKNSSPFKLVFNDLLDDKNEVGEFGIAVVNLPHKEQKADAEFVVLATGVDSASKNFGSIEEIQDHECPQLKVGKSPANH